MIHAQKFARVSSLVSLAIIGLGHAVHAQAPAAAQASPVTFPDIPANHWAYDAVTDLANKGYVKGYPNGTFLGHRDLTRYEFAMVVERMLQTITEINAKVAALPATLPATPSGTFASQDDLNKIQLLVDTFKTQLDTLTADVKTLKDAGYQDQIDVLRQDVIDTKDLIAAEKKRAQSAESTIVANGYGTGIERDADGKPRKLQIRGYVQARYQDAQSGSQAAFPSGTNANAGASQSVNGNYAVGGNNDTLLVRRARLKATGAVTPNTVYGIQLEVANTSETLPSTVKEAFGSYTLGNGDMATRATLTGGQFANFFGYTLLESSGAILAPERPLAFNEGGNGLWQNQDYDKGFNVSIPFLKNLRATAAVINGNGTTAPSGATYTNSTDNKKSPDELYRLAFLSTTTKGFKTIDLGVSYYDGTISRAQTVNPSVATGGTPEPSFTGPTYQGLRKDLGGADVVLAWTNGLTLRSEYVSGRFDERTFATPTSSNAIGALTSNAYAPNNKVDGYYVQASYTVAQNTNHPLLFGVNYDEFNRSKSGVSGGQKDQFGNAIAGGASGDTFMDKNWGYGIHYMLDKAARLRFWYDQPTAVSHAAGTPEPKKIGMFTSELQVSF